MCKCIDTVKRVAIVDFDVHHGNGTEETVRWLTPGLENTDLITPMGFGTISTPRYVFYSLFLFCYLFLVICLFSL
jgi:acetoin utilization deacetylase AcuC-like enzyme